MCAQTLRNYFEYALQQRSALDAVARVGWLVPSENLDLYEASRCAFDPASGSDEAFRDFEKIYRELAGPNWQVFRPSSPERDCWPPGRIFETIRREFQEFSWGNPVNLLTFARSGARPRLESCLAKMQGIKPKKGYPHMTVSKFLHFYNPGLFPIYDNAVIWGGVFKHFQNDFRGFCTSAQIPYDRAINDDTAVFLLNYMDWASSLLSVAHEAFMPVFIDWLDKQPGAWLHQRRFDPTTLYATAFEFTAIGATVAS
jgi:hypothetical protein